jgi:hypothetical protein
MAVPCKHGNELFGSTKATELSLSVTVFLKKDYVRASWVL